MTLSSLTPTQLAGGQIVLAVILAVGGFALFVPRPKGRSVEGIAALIAAAAVLGTWLYTTFGSPMPDLIGTVLFCLFSAGALGFGAVLVAQKNPARGAIAFAFVILSTCGLFLLLAAPFLMAATIIIYAGAIIVTFLFVLMLSQAQGPSDENDRSREPWLGALAGFAFTGLVLFALYLTQSGAARADDDPMAGQRLPAPVLTGEERAKLHDAVAKLDAIDGRLQNDAIATGELNEVADEFEGKGGVMRLVESVVGSEETTGILTFDERTREQKTKRKWVTPGSLRQRLEKDGPVGERPPLRTDVQTAAVLRQAVTVRKQNEEADKTVINDLFAGKAGRDKVRAEVRKLREQVLLLAGFAELPARNVGNLGYLLYTDHLLAVELAGTLLLVATIGAISIAHRKGAVA